MAKVSKDRMAFIQCSDFIRVREGVQSHACDLAAHFNNPLIRSLFLFFLADGPLTTDKRRGEHRFDKQENISIKVVSPLNQQSL